jgi:ABC-type uncharacterized transport system ATPase subunit
VIVGSFAKIGKQLEGYYDVMAAMDKLGHLFDMPVERLEGFELPRSNDGLSVSIHDLALEPLPSGQTIDRANLFVQPGQQLALVGMQASLRSQILQAIAGLRAPLSGHVEYGWSPYATKSHSWEKWRCLPERYSKACTSGELTLVKMTSSRRCNPLGCWMMCSTCRKAWNLAYKPMDASSVWINWCG